LTDQETLDLPQSTGAYVLEVRADSPAEEAGLIGGSRDTGIISLPAGGDLITAIDGQPVMVFGDLLTYLMVYKGPGDQVVLTILRDGEIKEVTVTLSKRP
jgi:2-alkenal reductase